MNLFGMKFYRCEYFFSIQMVRVNVILSKFIQLLKSFVMHNYPFILKFKDFHQLEEKLKELKKRYKKLSGEIRFYPQELDQYASDFYIKNDFIEEIINFTSDFFYIYDLNLTKYVFTNTGIYDHLGYKDDEIEKEKHLLLSRIVYPDDHKKYIKKIHPKYFTLLAKDQIEFEFRVINKEGIWKWFHLREAVYRRDNESHPVQILGVMTDITDMREAEIALTESEKRYVLINEATDTGIWDWQVGFDEIYYSDRWKTLLGYKPQELENTFDTWIDLIHPDELNQVTKEIEHFIHHPKKVFETEFRMKHKDGSYRWIHNRATATVGTNGKAARIFGSHTDITQEKLISLQVEKLIQAIHQSPVPIIITDIKGNIEFVNQKYCQLTGYQYPEVIGKKTDILKSGVHNKDFYQNLWKTILSGKTWNGEICNRKKSGELYWELASISPIFDEKGLIKSFVKVCENISEKKKIEAELKTAKDKAEIANIHKDNFLANMSHEIRTPLNGIIGFAEFLKDPEITQEAKEKYVSIIRSSSQTLLSLIDDIIDVSKLESGELDIQPEQFDLIDLMHELYILFDEMKRLKEKAYIKLILTLPSHYQHLFIESDKLRVRQVLNNLLSNALKFTEKGKIEFGFRIKNNVLEFFVSDTGIGIPQEKQKVIFERFNQSDEEISKRYGGTGLGLAISGGIVNILGGHIEVDSKPGKGSVFKFIIPFHRSRMESEVLIPEEEKHTKLEGKTILIAEDESDVLQYLSTILEQEGANVLQGKNGYETIEQFARHDNVDLILMDISMPVLDGYETARQIHRIDLMVPIIAQTTNEVLDERQKLLDIGCVDYITKPIKPGELIHKIEKYL